VTISFAMAKDSSRRSSAAGIARTSPIDNTDETSAQEGQDPSEITSSNTQPGLSSSESNEKSDTNGSNLRATESQPMTASNSTSSVISTKDAITSSAGAAAVPYGTRSRNRTGTSRPNYAEDKELDIEFEIAPPVKESTGRKPVKAADPIATDTGRPSTTARKNLTIEPDQPLTVQSHYKEPIPGTSTFSANPTALSTSQGTSKKRKTTHASSLQSQLQGASQNAPPTQVVTRRASMVAQVGGNSPDSNMLSFEECKGRLKDNKLIADDGTVLEVNGKAK
jgi:hypothetical protein